jgi:hypothetical protein
MELPERDNKRRKNASLISINDHLENATGIIQDITDEILKDFK